jgi:LIVCS family branched-chain amino acid:cation transporter
MPFLPDVLQNNAVFSLIYCSIVFILAYREASIIKILGLVLSPVKIVSFTLLVIVGLLFSEPPIVSALPSFEAFKLAIINGYNTMDLLATFFYCSVAFKSIEVAIQKNPNLNPTKMTLKACLIGAFITGLVYMGFMLVSYAHAAQLQNLAEEQMIAATSYAVLGKFGGIFVCVSVSFACVATALALAEVCRLYLYEEIFRHKVSKNACLVIVMVLTFLMSNLGFQGILKMSIPILNIIYPALIVLCIMNILHKWKDVHMVKTPVALTMLICAVFEFLV